MTQCLELEAIDEKQQTSIYVLVVVVCPFSTPTHTCLWAAYACECSKANFLFLFSCHFTSHKFFGNNFNIFSKIAALLIFSMFRLDAFFFFFYLHKLNVDSYVYACMYTIFSTPLKRAFDMFLLISVNLSPTSSDMKYVQHS